MQKNKNTPQRPFFLSILCVIVFVYSALFILMFISVVLFHNWITTILNDFLSGEGFNDQFIFILSLAGTLLYGLSFLGAYFIWKLKRFGFYLYALSSIALITAPYFFNLGSIISSIILIVLILSFALYYKKLN